jgi:hypothetical protein
MAVRVAQSVVKLLMATNPNVRVAQSVVKLILIPAPAAAVGQAAPFGGGGGFRPSTCGCSPAQLDAERVRRLRGRLQAWPYQHVFGDSNAIPVQEFHTIAAPAIGAGAVVLRYQVPSGFKFVLQALLQTYDQAFAPGDALWTVDVNSPFGATNVQAFPIQGLIALPVPLGSLAGGSAWPLPRAFRFSALDVLQSKVENVALGGGQFTSAFLGYLEPDVFRR